jgi:hypothetical protein
MEVWAWKTLPPRDAQPDTKDPSLEGVSNAPEGSVNMPVTILSNGRWASQERLTSGEIGLEWV